MKKWSGGTMIAVLALVLLFRYTILDLQPSTTTTTTTTPPSPSRSHSFFHPKPHLLPNLTGLFDLYSPPSPPLAANLSLAVSRSTLLWPQMRSLLSRSDALPGTGNGVKEAAVAWRELSSAMAVEAAMKKRKGKGERSCPYSVTGGWDLRLPCGLVQDSAITIMAVPRGRNGSGSGFVVELFGSGVSGEGEERERSVVLRYRVELGEGEIDGEGAFIAQNAWTGKGEWGKEEKCPAYGSTTDLRVDGLVACNKQVGWVKSKENISNGTEDGNPKSIVSSSGSTHLSENFPFIKEQPFTATLWAGLEGFHMSVNGKHETSFAYRERLEPWLVSEVKISGDLELLSSIANGLPITEDLETIMNIESLKAPPVQKKRFFLLVGVFSTANNFERRMALRRTWMQYEAVRSGHVAVRFFTGLHKSGQVNLELWKEAQTYEDIQLMPFVDYYNLISLKTIGICFFGTKILSAKYIMKTDDDAFVRIDEVLSGVKRSDSNGLLYGLISFESEPHRDKESKWYISPEEWPNDFYPPWAHGPGYIISRDIAKFIVQGHQERNLQMFKLEDVAMGIWIEEFMKSGHKVHYINDDRYHSSNCEDGYILAHYQGPRLILCLWEKLQKENEPICCE